MNRRQDVSETGGTDRKAKAARQAQQPRREANADQLFAMPLAGLPTLRMRFNGSIYK
jgi:hypothetical protein